MKKRKDKLESEETFLYKFKWLTCLTPLYISICAALLLDAKSNLKCDYSSCLYWIGFILFVFATIFNNNLSNRRNSYERYYDIMFSKVQDKGTIYREDIYKEGEKKFRKIRKLFEYFGSILFAILGIIFICYSYKESLNNSLQINEEQNKILQKNVDSILNLQHTNNSMLNDISEFIQSNQNITPSTVDTVDIKMK